MSNCNEERHKHMNTTNKAGEILKRMKHRNLFRSPETRDRVLDEFNQDNLDNVGQVGSPNQQSQVLNEMNNLASEEGRLLEESAQKIHTL